MQDRKAITVLFIIISDESMAEAIIACVRYFPLLAGGWRLGITELSTQGAERGGGALSLKDQRRAKAWQNCTGTGNGYNCTKHNTYCKA